MSPARFPDLACLSPGTSLLIRMASDRPGLVAATRQVHLQPLFLVSGIVVRSVDMVPGCMRCPDTFLATGARLHTLPWVHGQCHVHAMFKDPCRPWQRSSCSTWPYAWLQPGPKPMRRDRSSTSCAEEPSYLERSDLALACLMSQSCAAKSHTWDALQCMCVLCSAL